MTLQITQCERRFKFSSVLDRIYLISNFIFTSFHFEITSSGDFFGKNHVFNTTWREEKQSQWKFSLPSFCFHEGLDCVNAAVQRQEINWKMNWNLSWYRGIQGLCHCPQCNGDSFSTGISFPASFLFRTCSFFARRASYSWVFEGLWLCLFCSWVQIFSGCLMASGVGMVELVLTPQCNKHFRKT